MDEYNIIITNVSTVNVEKESQKLIERKYEDEIKYAISGVMTNEAPIKSILQRYKNVRQLIFIASDRVTQRFQYKNDEDEFVEKTHLELLWERISEYIQQENLEAGEINCHEVKIKDEPSEDDVSEAVFNVYNYILNLIKQNPNKAINIFIESNGGVRYVLTMLLSLTKTLENYYSNVHIAEITSMVMGKEIIEIKNTKSIYDTAQLTGIATEFVNYGRTKSLQDYIYNAAAKSCTDEQRKDIAEVLEKLTNIGDDIQLCRTAAIFEDFYGKDNIKLKIDMFSKKYEDDAIYSNTSTIKIFRHLLNLILEELAKGIYKNYDGLQNGTETLITYLPNLIKWCLDKSFIQQALTFCSEKIPEYLMRTGIIRMGQKFQELLVATKIGDYEECYYFLAHLKANFLDAVKREYIDMLANDILYQHGQSYSHLPAVQDTLAWLKKYQNLEINNKSLGNLFGNSQGFAKDDLDKTVAISNKVKTELRLALEGLYRDDNGNKKSHVNLNPMERRIETLLPELINLWFVRYDQPNMRHAKNFYDSMLKELFVDDENRADTFINEYSRIQSEKFYIKKALQNGFVSTKLENADDLQKILYLYSVCKEQRNISNHANTSDLSIAMSSLELKRVIETLLKMLV